MPSPRTLLSPTGLFGRLVAGASVILVLLLAVMAASPELHAWAHGTTVSHSQVAPDHDCAVTQFSHGLLATTAALAVLASLRLLSGLLRPCAVLALPAPRFWLPPLCGPPAA